MTLALNVVSPAHEKLLIGGEWIDSDRRIEVRNPARPDDLVGTIVRCSVEHVDMAVQAARQAQRAWGAKSFSERAEFLSLALANIDQDIADRASLFVRENGKTLAEATAEVSGTGKRQRMALSYAAELDAERKVPAVLGRTVIVQRPYGVVVSIVPWNSPLSLAFTQIVAALLAGNGVVLKPPETCPLTLIRTVRMFSAALPPGIINVITGLPSEIGDALTGHADVGKIGFTGSIAAARHIMANAANTIKGVTFELGGNDAAIVLNDSDLDEQTINTMVASTFQMSGQVCMAIKRIYVPAGISEAFEEAFIKSANKITVGDGLEPAVTMGPVHTAAARARAEHLIADAVARGSNVTPAGRMTNEAASSAGHFVRPTIVAGIADDAPIMKEEQFCPVIPIAVYDDVDEVIARANNSVYGLSASLWSRDVERAVKLATRIEAGQVWINGHGPRFTNHLAPYGGLKQSGIGRKSAIEGICEYLQSQAITTYEPSASK